jgi:hypothetical protein
MAGSGQIMRVYEDHAVWTKGLPQPLEIDLGMFDLTPRGPYALSSDAKCNTPADLISARLFRTLRSVAMRLYSHLDDERDQIAILRAAGRSMGAIARVLGEDSANLDIALFRQSNVPVS